MPARKAKQPQPSEEDMVTAAPQDAAPKAPKASKPRAPRKGKEPAAAVDAEAEPAPKPKAQRKPRKPKAAADTEAGAEPAPKAPKVPKERKPRAPKAPKAPKAPRKPRAPKSKEVKETGPVYKGDFALPKVRGMHGLEPEDFKEQLEAIQFYVEEAGDNISEDYAGRIRIAEAELQAAKAKSRFQKDKQLRDLKIKHDWDSWKAEEEAALATKVAKTQPARDKIDAAFEKKLQVLDTRYERATKRIQKKHDTAKAEAAAKEAKEEAEKQRIAANVKLVGEKLRMKRELEAAGKEYIHLIERADDLMRVHSTREPEVEALDSDVEVVRDWTPPKPAARSPPVRRKAKGPLLLEAPEAPQPPVTKRRVQVEEYIEEDEMTPAAPKGLPRPKPGAKKAATKVRLAK